MSPVIEFQQVSKKFRKGEMHDSLRDLIPSLARRLVKRDREALKPREFWVLKDLNFAINKGETVGVIGHNGAGKSTILKHLSGIMKPTLGRIVVNGRLSALIEIGAGFHPDLTGRENVFLNGVILGMRRAEVARKFDQIVDFSGLAEFIDTPVKRYSSGMFARLGFSVAAHLDPDILVIDEVLSVGDYVFQRKSLEKMHSVARNGTTVIFVSHNIQAVTELCKRSLLLNHGQLIADGPTPEVVKKYLEAGSSELAHEDTASILLKSIRVLNGNVEINRCAAGERLAVEMEVEARDNAEQVAIVLWIRSDESVDVFNTGSERLGAPSLDLKPGQRARCRFELDAHLAPGIYHIDVIGYRYDIQRTYFHKSHVWTLIVTSDVDVRGIANLYPRVSYERL